MRSQKLLSRTTIRAARRKLASALRRVAVIIDSQPPPVDPVVTESDGRVLRGMLPHTLRKDALVLVVGAQDRISSCVSVLRGEGFVRTTGIIPSSLVAERSLTPGTVTRGSVEALLATLADDSVDVVFCLHTFGENPDQAVVDELIRVSGRVIAVVPASTSPQVAASFGLGATAVASKAWPGGASSASAFAGSVIHDFRRMDKRESLYEFWRQPAPDGNQPHSYVRPVGRSAALVEIISDLPKSARILEIGCNVGRNLAYLVDNGFENVEGIEINPHAIKLLRETFPQLASSTIYEGPAGEHLPRFSDDEFDLVFTMAVLEHLHPDEAVEVFDHMVRVGRTIVAIEPEPRLSHRQFPHDIPTVFGGRGLVMELERPMKSFESAVDDAAIGAYIAWRFRRPTR